MARAVAREGTGMVRINSVPLDIVTPELARLKMAEPLTLVPDKAAKVDIDVSVAGGGVMGQAEATRTAIAKAIVELPADVAGPWCQEEEAEIVQVSGHDNPRKMLHMRQGGGQLLPDLRQEGADG